MSGRIDHDLSDQIATIRINNPARRNAMSVEMWHALTALCAEWAQRADIRVVVIRGEGELAFCAGADIGSFDETRRGTGAARGYDGLVEQACRAIEALPMPSIALVRGACFGAGCSIAASCDIRVASDDAVFAIPAARLGLGYDPRGLVRLVRVFGEAVAKYLLLTAGRLTAERAYALGAVHELAPHMAVDKTCEELARRIAGSAPLTVRGAKLGIRAAHAAADDDLAAAAHAAYLAAEASADFIEGRRAFAEKRLPNFTGQ